MKRKNRLPYFVANFLENLVREKICKKSGVDGFLVKK